MKIIGYIIIIVFFLSCSGEDRAGEQPFKPVVLTENCRISEDSCRAVLSGRVVESMNSSLRECGFFYGNDTLKIKCPSEEVHSIFSITSDTLSAGEYYSVAYAVNGVGTALGDTLYFTIP